MRTLMALGRLVVTTCIVAMALLLTWQMTGDAAGELLRAARSGRLGDPDWTLDRLVSDLACLLVLAAVGGFSVVLGLAATAVLTHGSAPRLAAACVRVTPSSSRRLVALWCGIGLVAPLTVAGSAFAAPRTEGPQRHQQSCHAGCHPGPLRLGGLGLPDLPTVRHRRDHLVVHPGDSLWLIARHRLPAAASDREVADLTARLYALNRSTIGADPDVIFPGMTLIAPESRF